ncbi:hypothetical protein [Actinophytocola algeriensis]|uniref:Uncharacterized protein n=1 Tax=Actinophytocola algeriensis TaxID=1768010 RepID=A0A7W7QAI4_9PSEU|nr:hypothetical protein [Actinophytocola algeriensis]MBB4910085.1 hypothetical protein [Actinophytocola algeriensis]MBE1476075.1 hypothetical protein [Actinophytocola algeriensis]
MDPSIEWENMYAHRCQACKRLYSDEAVRAVIAAHHQKKIADVLFKEWLLFYFRPGYGPDAGPASGTEPAGAGHA